MLISCEQDTAKVSPDLCVTPAVAPGGTTVPADLDLQCPCSLPCHGLSPASVQGRDPAERQSSLVAPGAPGRNPSLNP